MKRSLRGRRVLVTRPEPHAAPLVELLRAEGAEVILEPLIEVRPPAAPAPLEEAAGALDTFDWVVFASARAVEALWERLPEAFRTRWPARTRAAAVGPGTAQALAQKGVRAEVVPDVYRAEALVDALGREGVQGARVLLPQSREGRPVLAEGLARLGAHVVRVDAYETHARPLSESVRRALLRGEIDAVVFTSPSTVKALAEGLKGSSGVHSWDAFCIGPVTAAAAREAGFTVRGVAAEASSEAIAAIMIETYGRSDPTGGRG